MFKNIIVRTPSKSVCDGITSAPELGQPIYEKALEQHKVYIETLKECGCEVEVLPPLEEFPDSCFVEDVAVLTPNVAIITRPGADTRRNETKYVIDTINKYYPKERIRQITTPGTLEGGDVMMVGNHFYMGESERTNKEGCRQLIRILEEFGHTGSIVPLKEVLHLKTGINYIENNNFLVSWEFVNHPLFKDKNTYEIPEGEEYAANSLWVNDVVIVPKDFPKTKELIESLGYEVKIVDTSEFRKIDGGLSCLSLRFTRLK